MTFYTFCIIILFCAKSSLSFCIHNDEYRTHNDCVPCTKCRPPEIVIATCNQFRDTYCGPSPFLKQSDSPFGDDEFQLKKMKSTVKNTHFKDIKRQLKPFRRKKLKCDKMKNKHKREMCRIRRLKKKDYPLYTIPRSDNMLHSEISHQNYDLKDSALSTDEFGSQASTIINKKDDTFWTKSEVKLSIIMSVIAFDTILILLLVFLFCKHCKRNGNKNSNRANGQKLPNPSNTPVKCRFTAVLPSNSPQCLNDSPASTLLRTNRAHHYGSETMSQYSMTCCRTGYHQTDFIHNYPDSSLSLPRSNPHSTFQPRETLSHYSHPPNAYVMDRLLAENRTGDGHLPMENNVYVETWCNASSPVPPEACENVPFFAGFSAPSTYSGASSPIMLRTYRET